MYAVEVLFTDADHAAAAREALQGTRFGMAAREIVTVEKPEQYDRIAPFQHSRAVLGAFLGAAWVGLVVGVVLVLLGWSPWVDLTPTTTIVPLAIGVIYGAVIGLLAGSRAPAPGAKQMRRGIEVGHPVVRARFKEPNAAAFARSFLTSHPGAEYALAS
jgi:hypothetical protein